MWSVLNQENPVVFAKELKTVGSERDASRFCNILLPTTLRCYCDVSFQKERIGLQPYRPVRDGRGASDRFSKLLFDLIWVFRYITSPSFAASSDAHQRAGNPVRVEGHRAALQYVSPVLGLLLPGQGDSNSNSEDH